MNSLTTDRYFTIAAPSQGLFKDRGSRFIAYAYPISSPEEVKGLIGELKQRYYDARHHCYAWRIGAQGEEEYRLNDDGEPSGSAARPIYGQILSRELTNILVVVVRYFGGIKLGVPGLIHAYKEATLSALDEAIVEERTFNKEIDFQYGYLAMNDVMRLVKEFSPKIVEQQFDNLCRMRVEIRRADAERFLCKLQEVESLNINE